MNKKCLVNVKYSKLVKPQLFATDIEDLKINENVLIETDRGVEIGIITSAPINVESYSNKSELPIVIRRANESEIQTYINNVEKGKEALKIADQEARRLKIPMNFLYGEYILDGSKVSLIYTSEGRVDFRELLKILPNRLHARIDFRQIGARDKAKVTGGMGPCGREICCANFLKNFDGISIARARNQQLSLNNQKLSGSCGKLMCCLLFEDDVYTIEAKDFPPIGSRIKKDNVVYKVLGFNIINRVIKCEGPDGISFIPLKDLKRL